VKVVASGANQPFRERQLGSTRIHRIADGRFAVLMDCLANLGMARTFSYLMEDGAVTDDEAIFDAVDATHRDGRGRDPGAGPAARPGPHGRDPGLALDRIGAP
jgi:hypothetical protein